MRPYSPLALAALLLLAGCGGGGGVSSPSEASERGTLSVSVAWPQTPRFVPLNARLIRVQVFKVNTTTAADTIDIPVGTANKESKPLDPGDYYLVAKSYPDAAGAQPAISSIGEAKDKTVQVEANKTKSLPLTMATTLSKFGLKVTDKDGAHTFSVSAGGSVGPATIVKNGAPLLIEATPVNSSNGTLELYDYSGFKLADAVSIDTADQDYIKVKTSASTYDASSHTLKVTVSSVKKTVADTTVHITYKGAGNGGSDLTFNLKVKVQ